MEHSLGHLQRRSSEWNVGAETEWTEAGGGKEGDQESGATRKRLGVGQGQELNVQASTC